MQTQSTTSHAPADLAARIARLEREARRWRTLAGLGVVALACVVAMGFAQPQAAGAAPETLEARRFVLRGPDGAEQAVLGIDDAGNPSLLLQKEKAHAFLTLSGPGLILRGDDGKQSAFLGIDTQGTTRLDLTSPRVTDGVRLAAKEDGGAGVYVVDAAGRERVSMDFAPGDEATGSGDNAQLAARDEQGRVRASLAFDKNGVPSTVLLDRAGLRRIGMLIGGDGLPLFAIEDGQGQTRTQLTTRTDGTPLLRLNRPDGQASFEAP